MKTARHVVGMGVAWFALAAVAECADAQVLKRVEVKATVTNSNIAGIPNGEVINVDARPNDVKVAFPTVAKIKMVVANLTISSGLYKITGKVGTSSIQGVPKNSPLECTIDFLVMRCLLTGGDVPGDFSTRIRRLHVVEQ